MNKVNQAENTKHKSSITSSLFVIIAASLWAVDGIVLTPSLYSLPVTLVVFIESMVVALLLTPFFKKYFTQIKNLAAKDWLAFIGVALFGGAIGTMAITRALFYVDFVNLSIVVLIQKMQPIFAIALAGIILKEKLEKEFFIWAGIAIISAYIMTFGFSLPNLDTGNQTTLAALFALLAAASFGSSTVLSKRALRNVSYEVGTYLRFFLTAIIMLTIVLSSGTIASINQVTNTQVLVFTIIAFTTGGPAIFLYYYGLKNISASIATICELAFPLVAVVLEYFVHGNILSPVQWIGAAFLLLSILRISGLKVWDWNKDN
ncbi:MAG TPA: EamA family transporter [Ignavibacteriaceae bacterium]|nr:EamA family transporter [Ignavibacteriaceae bacterium]HRP91949.1 EamA family transporter [Ignavibacteriaceae bacterium]HRQ54269.1 EamA family transporter [Ignavibacteriaceae bacterium]